MIVRALSAAPWGIDARSLSIEVELRPGDPRFDVEGLGDASARETRHRVRSAVRATGFEWSSCQVRARIQPIDQPKDAPPLDLAIAAATLAALGELPAAALDAKLLCGELDFDGTVRTLRGGIAVAETATREGVEAVFVPARNAAEAASLGSLQVLPVRSLSELVDHLRGVSTIELPASHCDSLARAPDFREVRGSEAAKRAFEVAAAGGHHLMMVGPPGSGKVMLARRLPGILPPLEHHRALEVTKIASTVAETPPSGLVVNRPLRAPHPGVSTAGMTGGGRLPRPGEVTLAHGGVLPADSAEDDHLALLGLLNSSTACFWMKQVYHCKGAQGINEGGKEERWEQFYEHDGTKTKAFPVSAGRPLNMARLLDELGRRLQATTAASACTEERPSRETLKRYRSEHEAIRQQMIALQEELDWRCYKFYDLIDQDLVVGSSELPPMKLGERAFEIVLARRIAAGETETSWFERHGSTPTTEIPQHWPAEYRALVERRLQAIADNKSVRLIERPEYKRRWQQEPWEKQEQEALRGWLLDRLEAEELWQEPRLLSTAKLADRLRRDKDFRQVAALYRGRDDFDLTRLVTELVEGEGVPYLAEQRHKPSGMRKRKVWEEVWDLQRAEDAIDARVELPEDDPDRLDADQAAAEKRALDIPVPPKYARADFRTATAWRLRGKLDVPKERFVLHPGAERQADPTPVVGWAGWDHLQRARALATYYVEARDQEAWDDDRLSALLDGLDELLPWLLQWHNEVDLAVGMGMGTYFKGFVEEERRLAGLRVAQPR